MKKPSLNSAFFPKLRVDYFKKSNNGGKPEGCRQDIPQRNQEFLTSSQNVWHCLHNTHNCAADRILMRMHQWLQVLTPGNDCEEGEGFDLRHTEVVVQRHPALCDISQ